MERRDLRGWRGSSRRAILVAVAGYLVVNLPVLVIEYSSEMSKIRRGFWSDTVSPFFFTNLLTFPTSVVHSNWSGYPLGSFRREQWRELVQHAVAPTLINLGVQVVVIAAVVFALTRRRRGCAEDAGDDDRVVT